MTENDKCVLITRKEYDEYQELKKKEKERAEKGDILGVININIGDFSKHPYFVPWLYVNNNSPFDLSDKISGKLHSLLNNVRNDILKKMEDNFNTATKNYTNQMEDFNKLPFYKKMFYNFKISK